MLSRGCGLELAATIQATYHFRLNKSIGWTGWSQHCWSGHMKDKTQTMISTDIMILANIHHLPHATCHLPHTIHHPLQAHQSLPVICHMPYVSPCPASATEQVSISGPYEYTSEHIVKWNWKWLPSWECTWECLESKPESYSQADWNVSSSAIERVIESIMRAYMGGYSQADWECAIECNWEHSWMHVRDCTWEHLERLAESIQHADWECAIESNWMQTVTQGGRMQSSAIRSVLGSV